MTKDMIKDLQRSFSWIVWVGPKRNHMYLREMQRLEIDSQRRKREKGKLKMEAEIGTQAQERWQPPEAGRGEGETLLYSLTGNMALLTLISVGPY